MSVASEKSLNNFSNSSHGPCFDTQFCHPRQTGQLPTNAIEKPRKLCSNRKYFYQNHVSKHESHTIYTTGDSCDDIVGGPAVRKCNDKNKTKEFCKKIKCTRTTNSNCKDDQSLCAFWYLLSEYLRKMYQFYWSVITIRCPVRRSTKLGELSCEMRGVLFCLKRDMNIYLKNALCMPAKKSKEVKQNGKKDKHKKEHKHRIDKAKGDKLDNRDEKEKKHKKHDKKDKHDNHKHHKKDKKDKKDEKCKGDKVDKSSMFEEEEQNAVLCVPCD